MNRTYKKLTAMVIGVLLPILNSKLNIGLSLEELALIESAIVAFIIGQGIADNGKERVDREYDILFNRAEAHIATAPSRAKAADVTEMPN